MTSRPVKTKRTIVHRPTMISPSLTSLFTQSSNGSSGSGSTVTQDSVTKRPRTQKKTSRRTHGSSRQLAKVGTDRDLHARGDKPDVFAFMEEEEEGEEDNTQIHKSRKTDSPKTVERRSRHGRPAIPPPAPESPISAGTPFTLDDIERIPPARASSIASLHSDSGISIRGPSPERSPAQGHKKSSSRSSMLKNHTLTRTKSVASTSSTSSHLSRVEQLETPESYYAKPQTSQSSYPRAQSKGQQSQTKPRGRTLASSKIPPKHGYNFLASRISAIDEESIRPIYRRFETLTNRILIVMQNELLDLEERLARIDREIEEIEGSATSPNSHRAEHWEPTPLHTQRMYLVGMIVHKLGEYNKTMASYHSVVNMPVTSVDQIKQYKDLLEQHKPLIPSETAFLDETTDLITVGTFSAIEHDQQRIRYELGATLFFLILAFRLIPSFIGRMVLGGSVVGALAWSGRLLMDEDAIAGVIGRRVGIYATAIFILSLTVG